MPTSFPVESQTNTRGQGYYADHYVLHDGLLEKAENSPHCRRGSCYDILVGNI